MNIVKITAPAKINLDLRIGHKQENGLHEIRSKVCAIDLCDRLTVQKVAGQGIAIEITGPQHKQVPTGADNLAHHAARLFFQRVGLRGKVKITIEKNIPMCAGLGGGSSDAAATLLALGQLFQAELAPQDLQKMALALGSDVPFFASCQTCAQVTGTGECVQPLPAGEFSICVAMLPRIRISTAWAFAQLGKQRQVNAGFANDFMPVVGATFPGLLDLRQQFLNQGAFHADLTGTGAAVFGLFHEPKAAQDFVRKHESQLEFACVAEPIKHSGRGGRT